VAPQTEPTSWNPADPGDSNYNWAPVDAQIKGLANASLEPIFVVADAPVWARLVPASPVSAPDRGNSPKATCGDTISFDVWATHPYTSGGPTHHAALPYDVSLGDLSKMTRTLRAAEQAGHVKTTSGQARFWVKASESTADLIAWFLLMDQPPAVSFYQSGLYFQASQLASAKPKPFFEASGRRWKQVKKLGTDRYGIAQAVLKIKPTGQFRALLGREKSLAFSMRVPADRFFNPFGQTTLLEPNGRPNCSP
jgi:hypothetical protein